MPDKEKKIKETKGVPFIPAKPYEGQPINLPSQREDNIILPGGKTKTKYDKGLTGYSDPYFTGGLDRDFESRMNVIEAGLDSVQSKWDKLGNGVVKFAGSFADGILSTVGTIYGIPASIITQDETELWDNPFTNLGHEISQSVNENFSNYQSLAEKNASAWSPTYWATLNFVSDNILGNLGYAAAAYVTGGNISKLLSKAAPYIAGKNLITGLDVIASGGDDIAQGLSKAYSAAQRWDKTQQAISLGISAAGESSVEALSTYKEAKANMTRMEADKYGGEEFIPESVKQKIDEDAKSAGNLTYAMNLPILAGANFMQWGKSLSGFNSEFKQMSKNVLSVKELGEFGTYAARQDLKTGVSKALYNGLTATGKALKSNLSEAAQEGLQFIAAEGNKSWYQRLHDPKGWEAFDEYTSPYLTALEKLVTTKDGVANLLGGFAGGVPFGLKDYVKAVSGDPAGKKLRDEQLNQLNNPFGNNTPIRENLKTYIQNNIRHASAEADLQKALLDGNELEARNAKNDQLKSYINSRIKTGRMDLLENEINQLSKLSNEDFKQFFGFDENTQVDKGIILDKFKNTAKDMHETYQKIDRLFNPDMYKLNSLSDDEKKQKLADLGQYKDMLWSYMVDYKDRESRANSLDSELSSSLGGLVNVNDLFKDEFKSTELNDLYRQYVAASVEKNMLKASSIFANVDKQHNEATQLQSKIKAKILEVSNNNPASFSITEAFDGQTKKDYIEDYLFNIDKRILPALNNPVVQSAMNKEDINSLITKVHDLAELHNQKRTAINSYNQLANAVKSGSFMSNYMDNPEFDKEKHGEIPEYIEQKVEGEKRVVKNPEYIPAKITNDEFLKYDNYSKNKNERKSFYEDLRASQTKNKEEQDDFENELSESISETSGINEKNKDFHNQVGKYHSENTDGKKSTKSMTNDELIVNKSFLERTIDSLYSKGEFDISTKKQRSEFPKDKYVSLHAQLSATYLELNNRKEKVEKELNKKAKDLVAHVTANNIPISELEPGFKIKNQKVDNRVLLKAKKILIDKENELAEQKRIEELKQVAEPANVSSTSNVEEPLVTDAIYESFKKKGKIDVGEFADFSVEFLKKLKDGIPLTPREKEIYDVHKEFIDKSLLKKYGVSPILKTQTFKNKTLQLVEPAIVPSKQASIINEAVKIVEDNQPIEKEFDNDSAPFIRLMRSDVIFDKDKKENEYDTDGNVFLKQFTQGLFSQFSNQNLHNKPQVRFRYIPTEKGIEPSLVLETKDGENNAWQSTNYYLQGLYDRDGKLIDITFDSNPEINKKRLDAFRKLIKSVQDEAIEKGTVEFKIKGDPTIGKLIKNKKTEDGIIEPRPLITSFGTTINDINNPTSVKLGVLSNHYTTDATVVYKNPKTAPDELSDVNEILGVHVPKSMVNAIAKVGGNQRGGQYVALLPTGKMHAESNKQIHMPVLLSNAMLSDNQSSNYNIGSGGNRGTKANMGEVLVDVLLNPHKEEYSYLWPSLFEMAGLPKTDYKGLKTDWKSFYNNENVSLLLNKLFFAKGKTLSNNVQYALPFNIEVVDTSQIGGAIMLRIGLADNLSKDKKSVDIFLTTKEGVLVTPKDETEAKDFVQHRINKEYDYRKEQGKKDESFISYEDIQNVIKDKSFHVQLNEMYKSDNYSGFVFDNNGTLQVKQYPNYVSYVDDLKLLTSNIQGIEDPKTKNRQYFINQVVYFSKLENEKTQESKEPTVKKEINKQVIPTVQLGVSVLNNKQIVAPTQSEIASKTQDEFAQYLQDNHSDKLSQEQIYKLLTVRPELREKMLNESPQEWAKIFEKNSDYRQQANNVDNNKEMRGNANPAWTGISIGETANQESDGRHKGYVTLSVDSAREMGKNLEQTFKDLYSLLKDAGYNGHLKMPGVYSDLLTRFDNIVIHGATKSDVSLALPIIEQYFKDKGLNVEGTKTGIDAKDSNGKETSHTNLLAEKVKNKALESGKSKTLQIKNQPSANALNNSKSDKGNVPDAVGKINSIISSRKNKKPLIDLAKYKSILQRGFGVSDTSFSYQRELIVDELANMLLDRLVERKELHHGSISVLSLKRQLKKDVANKIFEFMQKSRDTLKDKTFQQWSELSEDHPDYDWLSEREIDTLPEVEQNQYNLLLNVYEAFDIDEIQYLYDNGQMSEEELEVFSTGIDPVTNKPNFFIGYGNLALSRIASLNIISVANRQEEIIDLDVETGDYTQRFDDGWSLMVNPKDTLGLQAKVLLNTVPEVKLLDIDGVPTILKSSSNLGFPKYLNYDTAFIQVMNLGLNTDTSNFEYDLMYNPIYENSPIIKAIRLKLEDVKQAKGLPKYTQHIKQLSNAVGSLKINNVNKIIITTHSDKNAVINIIKGSKSNISDQIAKKWQSQFISTTGNKQYIVAVKEFSTAANANVDVPKLNLLEYEIQGETKTGTFVEYFNDNYTNILKTNQVGKSGKLTFEGYLKIARLIKDVTGLELVEGDFDNKPTEGYTTAHILSKIHDIFTVSKKEIKEDIILKKNLKKSNVKSFSDFIDSTIKVNILGQIKNDISVGKLNLDEPFANSTTALNLLSKVFDHFQKSVVNPQAKNGKGKNQYIYIKSDMLNHEVKKLKTEEELSKLRELPIGKYDYHLNEMFTEDEFGNVGFKLSEDFREMAVDSLDSGELTNDKLKKRKGKNKGSVIQARSAATGDIDIMSLALYQNQEESKFLNNKNYRGQAKYLLPFGDSSTAQFLSFTKYDFNFEYNNGELLLKDGTVKEILYGQFKSELNRIKEALELFDSVNNQDIAIEDKKAQLTENYHYYQIGDKLIPGAASNFYYFGQESYDGNTTLFDTYVDDAGKTIKSGLKSDLVIEDTNQLNDDILKSFFDGYVNEFLTKVVNDKLKQLQFVKSSFFDIQKPELLDNGRYASPKFTSNLIDFKYIESLKRTFLKNSKIDERTIKEYFNKEEVDFATEQEAMENGYHSQLFKTMVIDQQVNAFVVNNLFRKLTWDFAAFDNKGNYLSFVQNLGKRESAFVSPYNATNSASSVNLLIYNDLSYGSYKLEYQKELDKGNINKEDIALFDFMNSNGLSQYLQNGFIPEKYKELSTIHYFHKTAGTSNEKLAGILKAALNSSITDGGTIITLREYLYQMVEDGEITSDEFGVLYNKYNNPNLKESAENTDKVLFKGRKMVAIGSKYEFDRKAPVYIKDAKMVLIPSQVKGTIYESILNEVSKLEDTSTVPSPGYQLVPKSGAKLHNGKVFDLYDSDGKFIPGSIASAETYKIDRAIYGQQVENPDKKQDSITQGTQLLKYMFLNIADDKVFAKDMFEITPEGGVKILNKTSAKTYGGTNNNDEIKDGITGLQLKNLMVRVIREMHERRFNQLIDKLGLAYSISNEWKDAANEMGYTSLEDFEKEIDRLSNSNVPEERNRARDLTYSKFALQVKTISKMISDIKNQAYERKQMDVSQLRILDEVVSYKVGEDYVEQLKMPLSFTSGNKQFQQVLISQLESLFANIKINGFSGIQISTAGHSKIEGSSALKGYSLQYGQNGEVVGVNPPEIAVPWLFKDTNGKKLDYDNYVNPDGSIKLNMFDEEVLNIIGYRIPNTGLNMAARFKIVRFFKPEYKDAIMIPDILYSQMGTDLDFDKLYNYLSNYKLDKSGKILKVNGVLHPKQKDAQGLLNQDETLTHIAEQLLFEEDPTYRNRLNLYKRAYGEIINQLKAINPDIVLDTDVDGAIGISNKSKLEELKFNLTNEEIALPEQIKLKAKYDELSNIISDLEKQLDSKKMKINLSGYINKNSSNYLKAQTDKQLENVYMDMYHIVMSDMDMIPSMLTPLTSDLITSEVNNKIYNGQSLLELQSKNTLIAPSTESYQVKVRGDNRASGENIGSLANGPTTTLIAQMGGFAVGLKGSTDNFINPVVFLDESDNIIEEDDSNETTFVSKNNPLDKIEYDYTKMSFSSSALNKEFNIPYRLDRIYGINGSTKVTDIVQSALQAFLDFNNDKGVAQTNINNTTMNALMAALHLGYTDHALPLLEQDIIVEYAKREAVSNSNFIKSTDVIYDLVADYVGNINIPETTWDDYVTKNTDDKGTVDYVAALSEMIYDLKLGDAKYNQNRFFKVSDLRNMIEQNYTNNKNEDYYVNQLHVLNSFLRLKPIGDSLFFIQQDLNFDSKGFKDKSILGVNAQIQNYEQLSNPYKYEFILNSERMGKYGPDNRNAVQSIFSNAAKYAKKSNTLLKANHNMFTDMSPFFITGRQMLGQLTDLTSLDSMERYNINLIQYVLSNHNLYSEFFTDDNIGSADDLRRLVYLDEIETTTEKVSKFISKTNVKVLREGLSRMIDRVKNESVNGITYGQIYPVLTYLQTSIKNDNSPSWVYTSNINQFKERIAQEIPYSVAMMFKDENPEINKIAKMLFAYYYMGGGTVTPQSFGHLLPQELLFSKDGFADKVNALLNHNNNIINSLNLEVNAATNFGYDKPKWFGRFDKNVVVKNVEAAALLRGFYVQFLQNNPFNAAQSGYKENTHFEPTDRDNIVKLTNKGKVENNENPPSFRDENNNIYVINSDYNTYTKYNRAGTPLFTEYNYGSQGTPTIIPGNQIKAIAENIEGAKVTLGGTESLNTTKVKNVDNLVLDTENDLQGSFDKLFFGPINSNELDSPVEAKELTVLAEMIAPLIPAGTKLIPYSIQKATKLFNPVQSGMLTVNGFDAFGSFKSGNPFGVVELAYEKMDLRDEDPLIIKKALLHESGHAAISNVITLMDKLDKGEMTAKDANEILQVNHPDLGGVPAIKDMLKSYKKLSDLYESLKSNTVLRKAYVEEVGAKGNKKNEENAINQLNQVIFKDVHEFTAWMLNHKPFRDALKKVPYKDKSIFDRILELLKDVLGLNKDTAAYNAFGNLFRMMEPIKYSKIPKSGYTSTDVDRMFSANSESDQKALTDLRNLYKGVSNFDAMYASPEELRLYDEVVKDGKIIC